MIPHINVINVNKDMRNCCQRQRKRITDGELNWQIPTVQVFFQTTTMYSLNNIEKHQTVSGNVKEERKTDKKQ